MRHKTVLITGANAGIGFEAAAQFAELEWDTIILACRSLQKAETAQTQLTAQTHAQPHIFQGLALELAELSAVHTAADTLKDRGQPIDVLLLNAGMSVSTRQHNSTGVELTTAANLLGHHVLTMRLLTDGLIAPNARIIISGSEAARGDIPGIGIVDYPGIIQSQGGDVRAGLEAIAKGQAPKKFKGMEQYSMVKLLVAWWAGALARRLPKGTTVNAVSPGAASDSRFTRNQNAFMRYGTRLMTLIGPRLGVTSTSAECAKHYLDAIQYSHHVNGCFFAAPIGKVTGALVLQDQAPFQDEAFQEACWDVVEKLSAPERQTP